MAAKVSISFDNDEINALIMVLDYRAGIWEYNAERFPSRRQVLQPKARALRELEAKLRQQKVKQLT